MLLRRKAVHFCQRKNNALQCDTTSEAIWHKITMMAGQCGREQYKTRKVPCQQLRRVCLVTMTVIITGTEEKEDSNKSNILYQVSYGYG